MTAVTIRGLDGWQRRLAAPGLSRAAQETLRREAEAIAEDAARGAPGRLGQTVELHDQSRNGKIAYAVGTSHRAGWFLEHGTVRMPARPWLSPVFRARLPRVKRRLRNTLVAAFGTKRSKV